VTSITFSAKICLSIVYPTKEETTRLFSISLFTTNQYYLTTNFEFCKHYWGREDDSSVAWPPHSPFTQSLF